MMRKKISIIICMGLALLFGVLQPVMAAYTGKIAGKVIDKDTGDPLIGANIMIEGTSMGAAAGNDGRFFFINIPPGICRVKSTVIGYTSLTQTNIHVMSDLTTEVNFELSQTVIEGEEVVIIAERPIIQKDVAGSQMVMDEEDVQAFSQDGFSDFLSTQGGVSFTDGADEQGISIRGGHVSETNVLVDGVSMQNAFSKQAQLGVALSSIKEVTIRSGGFTAEYGDLRSGLVSVVTKEGSQRNYSATLDMRMGYPGQSKIFGESPFSVEGPVYAIWAGPNAFTGVSEGYLESLNMDHDPTEASAFQGWNSLTRDYLVQNPDNIYTPQQYLERWRHEHPTVAQDGNDYIIDGSLGGPLPLIPHASFFLAGHYENLQLALPLSGNNSETSTTQAKFTFHLTPSIKLNWINIYSRNRGYLSGRATYQLSGMITGASSATDMLLSNLGSKEDALEWAFPLLPQVLRQTYNTGFIINHALSARTFYTLQIDGSMYRSEGGYEYPDDYNESVENGGPSVVVGNMIRALPPNPVHQFGVSSSIDGVFDAGASPMQHDDSKYTRIHAKGVLESQISYHYNLKAGFEFSYTDYDVAAYGHRENDVYAPPVFDTLAVPNNAIIVRAEPVMFSTFIQNKLEFGAMIANLGLRYDMFNARQAAWDVSDTTSYYTGDKWQEDPFFTKKQTGSTVIKGKLSPRLGLSFPATESSKFFVNYGMFYQTPLATELFAFAPRKQNNGGAASKNKKEGSIPNLDVDWPKTIAYEVGFEKALGNNFLFRITGYLKDVTNEIEFVNYYDALGSPLYSTRENVSYRDIRGLELRLQQRQGRYGYGWADFEYSTSTTGLTGLENIHLDPVLQSQDNRYNAFPEKEWPTMRLSCVYNFRLPKGFGPDIAGIKPLSDWSLQLNGYWEDGGKRLFNPGAEVYNRHYIEVIDGHNLDLNLKKRFAWGYLNYDFYMRIKNVFNYKGRYNYDDSELYRASLKVPWETGANKGTDKWGESPDDKEHIYGEWRTWQWYVNPRNIMFGVELSYR